MLSISHTVHINAPSEKVWRAMVDVERWPEFAPQFRSIERKEEGPLRLGSSARVTPKGFFGADWTVSEYEEGRSFTWEASMLPGLRLVAGHVVEPEGDGVQVTLALRSSGAVNTLIWPVLGIMFRRNVRQEAEGLKAFCEGGGA